MVFVDFSCESFQVAKEQAEAAPADDSSWRDTILFGLAALTLSAAFMIHSGMVCYFTKLIIFPIINRRRFEHLNTKLLTLLCKYKIIDVYIIQLPIFIFFHSKI